MSVGTWFWSTWQSYTIVNCENLEKTNSKTIAQNLKKKKMNLIFPQGVEYNNVLLLKKNKKK